MYIHTHTYIYIYIYIYTHTHTHTHINGGSVGLESACNAGDSGLIPESGRALGEGNGCPLQYSCLGNAMGKGAWQAIPWGHTELDMTGKVTLKKIF